MIGELFVRAGKRTHGHRRHVAELIIVVDAARAIIRFFPPQRYARHLSSHVPKT